MSSNNARLPDDVDIHTRRIKRIKSYLGPLHEHPMEDSQGNSLEGTSEQDNSLHPIATTLVHPLDSSNPHPSFQPDRKSYSQSTTLPVNKHALLTRIWDVVMGDIYDPSDPQDLSPRKKNMITFIVALSGISGPIGSMIYMPGLLTVMEELNTSSAAVNGTVAAYVVFTGIAPLFWASMSDTYGRKPMYVLSLIISIVAAILCAVSQNISMLIVFRAVQACGSSSGQTLGAGVIADTIDVSHRGKAYGLFYIGPLVGPVIGPTIGGFLCEYLGWRSTFYFLAILGAVLLVLVTFQLPETFRKHEKHEYTVDDEGKRIETKGPTNIFQQMAVAFTPMVIMLQDPTIIVITIYNTVIFASLYFLNPTITVTFKQRYGLNSWQVGLCYLAYGVGLMSGSVLSGRYSDFVLKRLTQKKGPEKIYPELRMRAVFPAFILIPAGYLIYGWSTQFIIGLYVPIIGLFVYSLGQMSAFTPTSVYLVDSKPGRSASAIAINNCFRSVIAAIAAIFSTECVEILGPGVLFSILAGVNVLNIATVVAVMLRGKEWRLNFERKTGMGGQRRSSHNPTSLLLDREASDEVDPYAEELYLVHSRISEP
ncbi:major facilitator superfamily domain-containing protein [Pilobolus umbonatus]|nr:major facilitator superfamily domain-containing protein [Pilobolus umbonatus]